MSPVLWVLVGLVAGAIGFAVFCLTWGAVRDSAGTWLVERLRRRRESRGG